MEITNFSGTAKGVNRTSTIAADSSTYSSNTTGGSSGKSRHYSEKTREQKLEEIVNRFNDTETLRRDLSPRYPSSKGISSKTSSYNDSEDESEGEDFVMEDSDGSNHFFLFCFFPKKKQKK